MRNQKLIRFVQSFVLLPILTISGSQGGALLQAGSGIISTSQFVLSQKQNNGDLASIALNPVIDEDAQNRKIKAESIDVYFKMRNMPLHGLGMKMVLEAEKNNIDWRLLPAIAVRESTGGKHDCNRVPNNAFGWGSCKISFKSNEEAIEIVAKNLGGNNPNTERHYADKTVIQILRAYNPPHVVPRYAEQVISIMDKIGPEDTVITTIEKVNANT